MPLLTEQSDSSLLQEFAAHRSQDAFAELVSRHSAWVYSAAARMVRDPHLAEDVAQAVFLVMAAKAQKLGAVPLHRWLFKVTRYASANAIRARARRDKYERLAAMSSSEVRQPDPDQLWDEIAPHLDDSLSRLRSKDRDALLLRFYQQKSLAEVGAAMGVSEGAAKIRVLRAIDKLRTLLRRRGIAVPGDALSAVMIAHVTHAAPATVAAGSIPAAASIKATAISKGVSTMLITTKIKIVAAIILIAAIPIGARVAYVAVTDHPAPHQQVATLDVAAPEPAPVPDLPDATFDFDPGIAPFVTKSTDMIIAIDLSKVDVDAIAADLRTELGKYPVLAPAQAHLNQMLDMGVGVGKQWLAGFTRAGGSRMYFLSRADELTASPTMGMKLSATVVFPADSPEAARQLARYLATAGSPPPPVIGSAVVFKKSTSPVPHNLDLSFDPRPALSAALSAANSNVIRCAINPTKFRDIMPKFLASGKVPMNFTRDDWTGMQYCSLNIDLPPASAPGFLIISHYKDAATAQTACDKAIARIDQTKKSLVANPTSITGAMLKFIGTEKVSVDGSDVMATMDLHAYWDLIFSAVASATQPPTTQQHSPAL